MLSATVVIALGRERKGRDLHDSAD